MFVVLLNMYLLNTVSGRVLGVVRNRERCKMLIPMDVAFKWGETGSMSDGKMCCLQTKKGKVSGDNQGCIVDREASLFAFG